MKENSLDFLFFDKFILLHMKGNSVFFENGFVFDFLKMDKNKCPKKFF